MASRGGSSGWRRAVSTAIASAPAMTDRPTPTSTGERRDALVGAIGSLLPQCALPVIPAGGVHLWLRLPDGCSDGEVAELAAARGLAVSPGRVSFPAEPPGPYLRLSYSAVDGQGLVRAAEILADVLASL